MLTMIRRIDSVDDDNDNQWRQWSWLWGDGNADDCEMMALNYDGHDEDDQVMIVMKMTAMMLALYCFLWDVLLLLFLAFCCGDSMLWRLWWCPCTDLPHTCAGPWCAWRPPFGQTRDGQDRSGFLWAVPCQHKMVYRCGMLQVIIHGWRYLIHIMNDIEWLLLELAYCSLIALCLVHHVSFYLYLHWLFVSLSLYRCAICGCSSCGGPFWDLMRHSRTVL